MKVDVKYSKTVYAQAGLKSPNQAGLIIENDATGDRISLHSINAKDGRQTTWLTLQIPRENINDVIDALKQFR